MTQEEKELLLKDLCGRLPYGVIVQETFQDTQRDIPVWDCGPHYIKDHPDKVKPYLFPVSSMTEEQLKLFDGTFLPNGHVVASDLGLDYLNSIHVDYRGLIPMGLAADATGLNIY